MNFDVEPVIYFQVGTLEDPTAFMNTMLKVLSADRNQSNHNHIQTSQFGMITRLHTKVKQMIL